MPLRCPALLAGGARFAPPCAAARSTQSGSPALVVLNEACEHCYDQRVKKTFPLPQGCRREHCSLHCGRKRRLTSSSTSLRPRHCGQHCARPNAPPLDAVCHSRGHADAGRQRGRCAEAEGIYKLCRRIGGRAAAASKGAYVGQQCSLRPQARACALQPTQLPRRPIGAVVVWPAAVYSSNLWTQR